MWLTASTHLYHWCLDRIVAVLPTTFSNAFSWIKKLDLSSILLTCVHKGLTDNMSTMVEVNTLRVRQNECHFADNIFNCIFLNEYVWFPTKISLKFVPKGLINNNPSLVQIMAWCCPGDKPLSELMMVSLLMHICVTLPQWVKVWCRQM